MIHLHAMHMQYLLCNELVSCLNFSGTAIFVVKTATPLPFSAKKWSQLRSDQKAERMSKEKYYEIDTTEFTLQVSLLKKFDEIN